VTTGKHGTQFLQFLQCPLHAQVQAPKVCRTTLTSFPMVIVAVESIPWGLCVWWVMGGVWVSVMCDGWWVMSMCVHVCVEVVIIQDHFKRISPHTLLVYVGPQVNVYTHSHGRDGWSSLLFLSHFDV